MKNSLPHEGHRERLKNRFLSGGLANFEPHNVLELLLFYSIPRQDTNEIAHALIERFGSLRDVFDADFSELIKVKGIKENSATLIKLIPQISKQYLLHDETDEDLIFDHVTKVGEYLVKQYIGETKEVVLIMLLDSKYKLIKTLKIFEGSVNSAAIQSRRIVEEVIRYNASSVILAHNHPAGIAYPSSEDIDTTHIISSNLSNVEIHVLEHFIIAGSKYMPIMKEIGALDYEAPQLKYY